MDLDLYDWQELGAGRIPQFPPFIEVLRTGAIDITIVRGSKYPFDQLILVETDGIDSFN